MHVSMGIVNHHAPSPAVRVLCIVIRIQDYVNFLYSSLLKFDRRKRDSFREMIFCPFCQKEVEVDFSSLTPLEEHPEFELNDPQRWIYGIKHATPKFHYCYTITEAKTDLTGTICLSNGEFFIERPVETIAVD